MGERGDDYAKKAAGGLSAAAGKGILEAKSATGRHVWMKRMVFAAAGLILESLGWTASVFFCVMYGQYVLGERLGGYVLRYTFMG